MYSERSVTKKTQIRIHHQFEFAYVSVKWWEKLYKEDSNEDLTWICICHCISGMVREVLQRRLEDSTWICICQSISGIVREVLQKDSNEGLTWICICQCISGMVGEVLQRRLNWWFNMNMYLPAYQRNSERSFTKKTQMRIPHTFEFAYVSV